MHGRTGLVRCFAATLAVAVAALPAEAAPAVSILSPQPHETVHSNMGTVRVRIVAHVPYARLRMRLDEEVLDSSTGGNEATLHKVDRGEHMLQAELLDAQSHVIAASDPVVFYMWQASRLFPGRK